MQTQLLCNSCLGWCHLRNCSGLQHEREWSQSFVAPCCQQRRNSASSSASSSSSSSEYATPPPSVQQSQQPRQSQHLQQQNPSSLTPSIAVRIPERISILQFNCNGLQNKIIEITRFMHQHNIVVAAVQETKLFSKKTAPEVTVEASHLSSTTQCSIEFYLLILTLAETSILKFRVLLSDRETQSWNSIMSTFRL